MSNDKTYYSGAHDRNLSSEQGYLESIFNQMHGFEEPSEQQVGGDHYKSKAIQPWDYMRSIMSEEAFKGYLWGNIIKYMSRWEDKGGVQDIDKAMHYLSKLREHVS